MKTETINKIISKIKENGHYQTKDYTYLFKGQCLYKIKTKFLNTPEAYIKNNWIFIV